MILAQDAETRRRRSRKRPDFGSSRRAEEHYARDLRKLARHIGEIIRAFPPGDPAALPVIQQTLARYAEVIEPWARAAAGRMLEDVTKRDAREWASYAKDMGVALRAEIRDAPIGALLGQRLEEQVHLITSLPLDAAERVHKLTMEGLADSTRASEIAAEIMRSGDVSVSRANLIGRTETARTASLLTTLRAEHIGCSHFRWLTAGDSDVRPSHRKMTNKICEFASPPIVDGEPLIPGQTFNCRCTLLPLLPKL